MGNGYNHYLHHQGLFQRTTFLPMLCSRPSIKDVALPRWEDRSASVSVDPLSPKIGCMGQLKRNNKVVGYPTHKFTITTKNNNNVKYKKLKKLFSGKDLTKNTTTTVSRCSSRRQKSMDGATGPKMEKKFSRYINIVDMDPPLPVIKKVQKPVDGGDAGNLWKRRSGGVALKSLELQQIHHPRHHLQTTSVR